MVGNWELDFSIARHLTKNDLGLSYRFCYGVVEAHPWLLDVESLIY
jgi:hypothetical protein